MGDNVRVHGLASEAGAALNGMTGVVRSGPASGCPNLRLGVAIDGIADVKAIKLSNLLRLYA